MAEDGDVGAVRVDADGLGAGVADALRAGPVSSRVVDMRGGMPARRSSMFANCRAEWFYTLRERLDPGKPGALALPPSDAIKAQLVGIRWSVNSKGQIKVESKEDMRARGMKSPDEADAVAYACAQLGHEYGRLDMDLDHLTMENPWAL
jgi:hypothetical protein